MTAPTRAAPCTSAGRCDATGWWYVSVPELAGCHTQGRTLDQARARIRETLALWLDTTEDAVTIDEDTRLPEAS